MALAILAPAAVGSSLFAASTAFTSNPPTLGTTENWTGSPIAIYLKGNTKSSLGPFEVDINPQGAETKWKLEWQEAGASTWDPVPNGTGTIAAAEADETLHHIMVAGEITGLVYGEAYDLRLTAENGNGQAVSDKRAVATLSPSAFRLDGTFFTPPETLTSIGPAELTLSGSRDGQESHWRLESATSEAGPWSVVPGARGTGAIPAPESWNGWQNVETEAVLTGLTPETPYWLRLVLESGLEKVILEPKRVETKRLRPEVSGPGAENVGAASARLSDSIRPNNFETHWRFEYAESEGGPWSVGPEGAIPQAQADEEQHRVEGRLTGLSPSTRYFFRLHAESEPEYESKKVHKEVTSTVGSFTTAGPPSTTAFPTHVLHGEAMRLLGSVTPDTGRIDEIQTVTIGGGATGGAFTLSFEGHTTTSIPYGSSESIVKTALEALPTIGKDGVSVGKGGDVYKLKFGVLGGPMTGRNVPQVTADASGLTPTGTAAVATVEDGSSYDTRYRFEYVTQHQFEQAEHGGFAEAQSSPEVDLGQGSFASTAVGIDVPDMVPGTIYHYRLTASNTTPGNPVVSSPEHVLTVPIQVQPAPQAACPNEASRTGLSTHLASCRAYEQVSPIDKEGANEAYDYVLGNNTGALVGEDGEHFMFTSAVTRWGASPTSGQSPYFFSRSTSGWSMTAGAAQPEAGYEKYLPHLFSPDLTQVGLRAEWSTKPTGNVGEGVESSDVQFKAGPPGGPYATVASVPRNEVAGRGLVAASADFSKLVLEVQDHGLLGHPTGTGSGFDLYEYTHAADLRQLNVDSEGHTIGSCGANMVQGDESRGELGSAHSLSVDGSRVFFEAVPGSGCSGPKHLYVRDGSETLDIGAYRFAGANSDGTRLLLEQQSGKTAQFYLYDVGDGAPALIFSKPVNDGRVVEARDFTVLYVLATTQLTPEAPSVSPESISGTVNVYTYDIANGGPLRFLFQADVGRHTDVTPDGRYVFFQSSGVAGFPMPNSEQLYRYDSSQGLMECVSCASPFDPEPKLGIEDSGGAAGDTDVWRETGGLPESRFVSADGARAFFDTPSALVPQDVNGEVPPSGLEQAAERQGGTPSNDVYEWRADGVDGCGAVQGCVSLITPGTDGWLVSLQGVSESGRDVFIYTSSQLVPLDNDTVGDFYDVRMDGGLPPAVPPVECEGDSCLSLLPAPIDTTPASLAFSGPGNLEPSTASVKPKAKPKKRSCRHGAVRRKGRCVRLKKVKRAQRSNTHARGAGRRNGRAHGGGK